MRVKLVDPHSDREMVGPISRLLTGSTNDWKESEGGHVPDWVVEKIIHRLYTSEESITGTFAETTHRFAGFGPNGDLLATIAISRSPDNILVVDSSHLNVPTAEYPWVVPPGYHQIINFVTDKGLRCGGLARSLLATVVRNHRDLFPGLGMWGHVELGYHGFWDGFGVEDLGIGFVHDTEYDKYFEEGVTLPPGVHSPAEFNRMANCRHPRSAKQEKLMQTRKCRYMLFRMNFSRRRRPVPSVPSAARPLTN